MGSYRLKKGFNHFSGFLHHFVLAKLATSSIRVKTIYFKRNTKHESVKSSVLKHGLLSPTYIHNV